MNLFKSAIITIFILATSLQTFAQVNTMVGAKGGWVQSSLLGSDAKSQTVKSGFNAGAVINVASANHMISIQPEVLYSRRATELTYLNFMQEYEIQYVDIPLLLKVSLPLEGIRPNVFAGPYAGIKIADETTYTETITGISVTESNTLNGIDYGAVFGAGLDLDFQSAVLTLDGRYNLGMQELEKAESTEDLKNGSFSINLGALFYLNQ